MHRWVEDPVRHRTHGAESAYWTSGTNIYKYEIDKYKQTFRGDSLFFCFVFFKYKTLMHTL